MIKKYTLIGILFCSSFTIFAQTNNAVNSKITEVYGTYVSRISPVQMNWLNDNLQRSEVKSSPYVNNETIPKISSLKVINKYVPSLQMETNFDPNQINPLKYSIDFYSNQDQTFRIDGTDYVLLIKKKI